MCCQLQKTAYQSKKPGRLRPGELTALRGVRFVHDLAFSEQPRANNADSRAPKALRTSPMVHLIMFINWPKDPDHFLKRPLFSVTWTPKPIGTSTGSEHPARRPARVQAGPRPVLKIPRRHAQWLEWDRTARISTSAESAAAPSTAQLPEVSGRSDEPPGVGE